VPSPPPAAATTTETKEAPFFSRLSLEGFVDAYASVNYGFTKPQVPTPGVGGGNSFRAYDVVNGFALHWLGVNASYAPDPVGGTIGLRFGPSAARYAGTDAAIGLEYVKQAFASLRPGGAKGPLTIDFGKFDAPYGAEVADSQYNMNYTRSVLNFYGQPFFFTGLRVTWTVAEWAELKMLAVNGWNNTFDNNRGKSFGAQVSLKKTDVVTLSVGYMAGPEQSDSSTSKCEAGTILNRQTGACVASPGAPPSTALVDDDGANARWRHFVDVTLDVHPTPKLQFLFNGDYGTEPIRTPDGTSLVSWYGANLGTRYSFADPFALALRGEVYRDPQGYSLFVNKEVTLVDGTLTFLFTPVKHYILMIDNRFDWASGPYFQRSISDTSRTQVTTTLGVIVTSA
jgi:hypothetical protein